MDYLERFKHIIEILNKESFIQFVTIYDGNIWFVEQRNNKLSKISISKVPNLEIQSNKNVQSSEIKYSTLLLLYLLLEL